MMIEQTQAECLNLFDNLAASSPSSSRRGSPSPFKAPSSRSYTSPEERLAHILDKAFAYVNVSGSGAITRHEFVHWIRTRVRARVAKDARLNERMLRTSAACDTVKQEGADRKPDGKAKMAAEQPPAVFEDPVEVFGTSYVDALMTVGLIKDAAQEGLARSARDTADEPDVKDSELKDLFCRVKKQDVYTEKPEKRRGELRDLFVERRLSTVQQSVIAGTWDLPDLPGPRDRCQTNVG
mmetsp:Transcript_37519/g.60240  ORF Transcript_37519/g.60240 Transcript_37519/m.60240 type:complete len:238 (+) Transcript_37519:176-889(+)